MPDTVVCFICAQDFETIERAALIRSVDRVCPPCRAFVVGKRDNLARAVDVVADGLRVLARGRAGEPPLAGLTEELILERARNIVAALCGEFNLEKVA